MLPFLKNKRVAGLIISHRKPDVKDESSEEAPEGADAIKACAQDLLNAVQSNDVTGIAEALKSAFDILDSQPHEEGPHTNDYDSQNAKAAKEQE